MTLKISSVRLYDGTAFSLNLSSNRKCISGDSKVTTRRNGLSPSSDRSGRLRRIYGIVRMILEVVTEYSRTSVQKRDALNFSVSTMLPPTDSMAMQVWQSALT